MTRQSTILRSGQPCPAIKVGGEVRVRGRQGPPGGDDGTRDADPFRGEVEGVGEAAHRRGHAAEKGAGRGGGGGKHRGQEREWWWSRACDHHVRPGDRGNLDRPNPFESFSAFFSEHGNVGVSQGSLENSSSDPSKKT